MIDMRTMRVVLTALWVGLLFGGLIGGLFGLPGFVVLCALVIADVVFIEGPRLLGLGKEQ